MGPKERLEEMTEFVKKDLEYKSFSFDVTSDKNRFKFVKHNKPRGLILVNKQIPLDELIALNSRNKMDFGFSLVIFYKDGETFFKRMVDSSSWRNDKSLKLYTPNEINRIISLTVQERYALMGFSKGMVDSFCERDLQGRVLHYFQPQTERLQKAVRKFEPQIVNFDYSHIKRGEPGYNFANNTHSKTYFFLNEKKARE